MAVYKPRQLAEMFNISYTTILNLIKTKKIEAFKVGSQWRILEKEVERIQGIVKSVPIED